MDTDLRKARKREDARALRAAEKSKRNAPELKAPPTWLDEAITGAKAAFNEGIPHSIGNLVNSLRGLPEVPSEYRQSPGVFQEDVPTSWTRDIAENLLDPSNLVGFELAKPAARLVKKAAPAVLPAATAAYASDTEAGPLTQLLSMKKLANLINAHGYPTQDKAKAGMGWISARDWLHSVVPDEDFLARIVSEAGQFRPQDFQNESQYPFTLINGPTVALPDRRIVGHGGRHRIASMLMENGQDFDIPMVFQSYQGHPEEAWKELRGSIGGERFAPGQAGYPLVLRGTEPLQYGNEKNLEQFLKPGEGQRFAGGGLARIAARMAADAAPKKRGVSDIIKEKGGNWLSGSVEGALGGLKRAEPRMGFRSPEEAVAAVHVPIEEARQLFSPKDQAINSWIDKQLTRYVKNDMATEGDPIRALAERGVLHFAPEWVPEAGYSRGQAAGITKGKMGKRIGKSQQAQDWEDLSDQIINQGTAGDPGASSQDWIDSIPWLTKLQHDTPVYNLPRGTHEALGFDHLIDELSNSINPESGLPRHLQFPAERLEKVSVPQAVERVAQINAWRAAQKAEADALKANNAATVLHKEYPENNPLGLRWVELKKSDKVPEGWEFRDMGNHKRWHDPQGNPIQIGISPNTQLLQDALKYEGDTMGHRVGGYCEDVLSGRSRIFSLRDAKGQPHVTIETAPPMKTITEAEQAFYDDHGRLPRDMEELDNWGMENDIPIEAEDFDQVGLHPRIVQIKGKQNKAPNEEYLPFVQDFVKSGEWSDVGDLQNAGMWRNPRTGRYHTKAEAEANPDLMSIYESRNLDENGNFMGGRYASGGSVKPRITDIIDALYQELQNGR